MTSSTPIRLVNHRSLDKVTGCRFKRLRVLRIQLEQKGCQRRELFIAEMSGRHCSARNQPRRIFEMVDDPLRRSSNARAHKIRTDLRDTLDQIMAARPQIFSEIPNARYGFS